MRLAGVGAPHAPPGGEQVSAVDVQAESLGWQGVLYGVNDFHPQKDRLARPHFPRVDVFEGRAGAAEEGVVLLPLVNADDRPHTVIVGNAEHARAQGHIENRKIAGPEQRRRIQHADPCIQGRDRALQRLRGAHGRAHELQYPAGLIAASEPPAFDDELFKIEHARLRPRNDAASPAGILACRTPRCGARIGGLCGPAVRLCWGPFTRHRGPS